MVVYGGLRWFTVVYGGLRWFMVAYAGLWLFMWVGALDFNCLVEMNGVSTSPQEVINFLQRGQQRQSYVEANTWVPRRNVIACTGTLRAHLYTR